MKKDLLSIDDLTGDEFKAEIRHAEQRHLDAQAVIRHYGRTALAPSSAT